ncbi:hypothetical protein MR829_22070 [Paracoccus versutus]|uniref:TrbI/VirB10 family protein n=1 Tax=Paracoccus versutus TaxID=34007 RepID=UPI001FB73A67|nr:TrbI/VirB10 family protein [Paracoccus versutus]MCJ1903025.1 hypothetical protein [Paracoccus versutus]
MANENDDNSIQERLKRIQGKVSKPSRWRPYAIGAGTFIAGAALTSYAFLAAPDATPQQPSLNLPTSEVNEFQDNSGLDGFTISRPRPESRPAPQPQPQPEVQQSAISDEQLKGMMAEIAELRNQASARTGEMEKMQAALAAVRKESDAKDAELAEAERERMRLQSQLDNQAEMFAQQQDAAMFEQQRLAELQARRAEEEARRQAQIQSPMVAFRASGTSTGGGEGEERKYEGDEAFLRAGAQKSTVTRSQVIANPSNTIIQGTMIEATLETAINSALSGNVAANVSYDVWSMDMSQVLIPRGSKLYGRYSSDVDRGQRRVLIAWDRLVTSDGQSVQLEGYGTDRIGRSGMPGHVNNHTLARFGAAAAVSVIGALPAIITAAMEDDDENGNSNNDVASTTAANVGQGASTALGNVMQGYLDVPPTISVDQGAVVQVRVNNDLELF